MMKVLFVNLVYGVGSTGKIIADIMNLLKKYGNDVKLYMERDLFLKIRMLLRFQETLATTFTT